MHSRRWTAYGKIPIETGEEWGRQSGPHTDGQLEMGTVLMQGGWRGSFSYLLNLRLDLQILRKDFTNPGAPSDDSAFSAFRALTSFSGAAGYVHVCPPGARSG